MHSTFGTDRGVYFYTTNTQYANPSHFRAMHTSRRHFEIQHTQRYDTRYFFSLLVCVAVVALFRGLLSSHRSCCVRFLLDLASRCPRHTHTLSSPCFFLQIPQPVACQFACAQFYRQPHTHTHTHTQTTPMLGPLLFFLPAFSRSSASVCLSLLSCSSQPLFSSRKRNKRENLHTPSAILATSAETRKISLGREGRCL